MVGACQGRHGVVGAERGIEDIWASSGGTVLTGPWGPTLHVCPQCFVYHTVLGHAPSLNDSATPGMETVMLSAVLLGYSSSPEGAAGRVTGGVGYAEHVGNFWNRGAHKPTGQS